MHNSVGKSNIESIENNTLKLTIDIWGNLGDHILHVRMPRNLFLSLLTGSGSISSVGALQTILGSCSNSLSKSKLKPTRIKYNLVILTSFLCLANIFR
jgi:hypothetical protein